MLAAALCALVASTPACEDDASTAPDGDAGIGQPCADHSNCIEGAACHAGLCRTFYYGCDCPGSDQDPESCWAKCVCVDYDGEPGVVFVERDACPSPINGAQDAAVQ